MKHPNKCGRKERLQRLRRAAAAVLCAMMLLSVFALPTSAAAAFPSEATPTKVYLDGKEILRGQSVIIDSVTYVPLRAFSETANPRAEISWNAKTSTATVKTDKLTLTAKQGNLYITANGHYFYTVLPIRNLGGRIYVPIRPMARAFAMELTWNATARAVELTRGSRPAVATAKYNSDDVYWLSRIISAEAGGEPFLGQIAVGNVVLNRMRHSSYPNTIYGVIFDRKHGTQFSPVSFGTIYREPTAGAVIAAKICLEGYTLSDSILFFMNPDIATTNWISQNRPFAFRIGKHDFYN